MVASTRSGDKDGSANGTVDESGGTKHQMEEKSSPQSKRAKRTDKAEQQTIEETLNSGQESEVKQGDDKEAQPGTQLHDEKPADKTKDASTGKNGAAEMPKAREGATSASILEKGIIYFFFRGRVGIDEPSNVNDIARSYMVLRPIGRDAKLGEGTIGDAGNSRLIAIPKKVLPRSGKDRWIAFVEKSNTTFRELKDEFLSSSDYDTKTAGIRHSPAATPIGEGIYAITTTGRENHLAYMLTLPSNLDEVQKEMGLRDKGSFIISTRNPDYDAPKNVALPQGPDYPKDIKDEFRSLRWMATTPKHLDYVNTQFLLVGESSGLKKATEAQEEDLKDGKKGPLEELEELEDEDSHRMEGLKGDDSAAIYADLEVHAKDYPKLQTTF